ncbi:hypothetical protein PR048_032520 [Dryococelus australis]|uniref:Uncharacterized protein n=1 Tax=Dryococelus australis TaxID=614101 RepID=A0ABQ9G2F9_9NEOP|nr:hypothetical protein PR048_032520 [Dryococelus australis]
MHLMLVKVYREQLTPGGSPANGGNFSQHVVVTNQNTKPVPKDSHGQSDNGLKPFSPHTMFLLHDNEEGMPCDPFTPQPALPFAEQVDTRTTLPPPPNAGLLSSLYAQRSWRARCSDAVRAPLPAVATQVNARLSHFCRNSSFSRTRVAERLVCSPPTKAIGVQSPAGSLRIFASGNRAGRRRWSVGFLGDFPFRRPFIPALLHTSIILLGSQDLAAKSHPNISLLLHSIIPWELRGDFHFKVSPPRGAAACRRDKLTATRALLTFRELQSSRINILVNCPCLSQRYSWCPGPFRAGHHRLNTSTWSSAGMKGQGKWEISEKTRRPAASFSTIPTCEDPVTRLGIEPVSLRAFKIVCTVSESIKLQVCENSEDDELAERRVHQESVRVVGVCGLQASGAVKSETERVVVMAVEGFGSIDMRYVHIVLDARISRNYFGYVAVTVLDENSCPGKYRSWKMNRSTFVYRYGFNTVARHRDHLDQTSGLDGHAAVVIFTWTS